MSRRIWTPLVVALTVVGCESDATAPDAANDLAPVAALAAPTVVQVTPVFDEFGTGAGVAGTATLTRTKDGVWIDVDATGVVAGDAYTIWLVIFDNSRGCGKDGCDGGDLGSRQAQPTIVNGGGGVAGGANHTFTAHADRHDIGARQLLLGDAKGIDNVYKAEVHVILRSHGPAEADPADLAAQTSQVGAFCNLPSPPTPDGCSDDGVAVFTPAGPPGAS